MRDLAEQRDARTILLRDRLDEPRAAGVGWGESTSVIETGKSCVEPSRPSGVRVGGESAAGGIQSFASRFPLGRVSRAFFARAPDPLGVLSAETEQARVLGD